MSIIPYNHLIIIRIIINIIILIKEKYSKTNVINFFVTNIFMKTILLIKFDLLFVYLLSKNRI